MAKAKTKQQLTIENEELRARLQELEDTLEAIRSGAVDAIVASSPAGDRVYTLEGADQAYHTMVESMSEGAVTLMLDGTILYANKRFGEMTAAAPSEIIGHRIHEFVSAPDYPVMISILDNEGCDCPRTEVRLKNDLGADAPVQISVSPLELNGAKALTLVITDLTAQRRYEEIVAAEKLSRRILEQAHEGVAVCIDGCIVRANRALYEICGSIPLMQPFDQIFSLRISESQTFSVVLPESGKTIQNQEVRYQRPDGRIFNLILNAGPLLGSENKVLGSLISLLDISGRKQAEEVVQATLRRFYLMLASMYSGVLLMTDEGRIEFVNLAFCDFYGLQEAPVDLRGLASLDLLEKIQSAFQHPEEAAARIREILKHGQPVKGEEFAMRGGRTALRDFVPLRVDGKSCGRLWIHYDITELKQAEERLRQSESRFREMAETVPSIIFTALPDGSIDYFNERALDYAGLPAEEVMGEGWLKVVHPEDVDRSIRSVAESLLTGQPYEVMQRLRGADGSYRWFMARARAIRDEKGAVLRWFGSATDIHDMKSAEEALLASEARFRTLAESLEQRVQERTYTLQNLTEQLERGRHELRDLVSELVMAEERERRRIAGVLHDEIAQTLAAARMRLDLLQGTVSDQKDTQTLQEVKAFLVQSIQETRALMSDIGNPLLFDMGLKAACEAFAERLTKTNPVRIICDIRDAFKNLDPDVITILYQLVRELLTNVVKHSQARNAHVQIDLDDGHFQVRVADDGVGFDPSTLGAPSDEGGFGLYSIRERLLAINGSLRILSSPETGTMVTATLPAAMK